MLLTCACRLSIGARHASDGSSVVLGFTCTGPAAELAPRSLLDLSTNDATNCCMCTCCCVAHNACALALCTVQHSPGSSCPVMLLAVVSFLILALCCVCGLPCIQQRPVAAATHSLPAVGTRQQTTNKATIPECRPGLPVCVWQGGVDLVSRSAALRTCSLLPPNSRTGVTHLLGLSGILHVVSGMLSPRPSASARTVYVQGVCRLCTATRTCVDCSSECRLIACSARILSPWRSGLPAGLLCVCHDCCLLDWRPCHTHHSLRAVHVPWMPWMQLCACDTDAMDAAVFMGPCRALLVPF